MNVSFILVLTVVFSGLLCCVPPIDAVPVASANSGTFLGVSECPIERTNRVERGRWRTPQRSPSPSDDSCQKVLDGHPDHLERLPGATNVQFPSRATITMKTSSILALVVVLYGLSWSTFVDASPTPSSTTGLELTDAARNVISLLWNEASSFRKTVMSYVESLESRLTTVPREIVSNVIQYLRALFKQIVSFFGLSGNSFLGFDINNTSTSGKRRRSIVTGIVYPTHNLLERLT